MYQSNIYQYLEELKSDKFIICKNDKEAKQIETLKLRCERSPYHAENIERNSDII